MEQVQHEFLRTKEAAKVLRIHPYTLTAMARNGEIEAYRIRREWRFKPEVLTNYLTNQKTVSA